MKTKFVISLLIATVAFCSFFIESCKHDVDRKIRLIQFQIPAGFPPTVFDFQTNPLTEDGFLLGRKLFYDGRLSIDGNFPCASCHEQRAAFTTFEHDRSHGYNNSHTLRNAPGLFNLAWYPFFNQDGSAATLEAVYQKHLTDPTEMAETIENVLNKLRQDAYYRQLFRVAFGDQEINADRLFKALSQFVISLVSANSKYDKVKRGEATFNPQEAAGYTLFQANCASCHAEPLFTDFSFRNNGLARDDQLQDYGRMLITHDANDSLKFRVPSLRNVDLTSYYGHDGRFSIFRMMIQHYRSGINQSPTLDPLLSGGIALTNLEEDELVAFLRTLSDSSFIKSTRFRQ